MLPRTFLTAKLAENYCFLFPPLGIHLLPGCEPGVRLSARTDAGKGGSRTVGGGWVEMQVPPCRPSEPMGCCGPLGTTLAKALGRLFSSVSFAFFPFRSRCLNSSSKIRCVHCTLCFHVSIIRHIKIWAVFASAYLNIK